MSGSQLPDQSNNRRRDCAPPLCCTKVQQLPWNTYCSLNLLFLKVLRSYSSKVERGIRNSLQYNPTPFFPHHSRLGCHLPGCIWTMGFLESQFQLRVRTASVLTVAVVSSQVSCQRPEPVGPDGSRFSSRPCPQLYLTPLL